MPDRAAHLLQAGKNEAFLSIIAATNHRDWIIVVWFYICVQYVDAFLAEKGHLAVEGHTDRFAKLSRYAETRPIQDSLHRLYKESKEARYHCESYTTTDLDTPRRLYEEVRSHLRGKLGLPAS